MIRKVIIILLFKAKCSTEVVDAEYNVHAEFNKIKTQFNSIIPEEKSIRFDSFVDLDNNLSVCKPLNEIIQSEALIEVEKVDINGELITEENADETTTSVNLTLAIVCTSTKR